LQNFLFQYRTTPHTVTIPSERITEAHWQQLLCERDARGKLQQKEYVDSKRSAQYSDTGGDHILFNKSRDNRLPPIFEPLPYKVVEEKGNAVLIQDQEGNNKLRNASHMKKFIQLDPPTEATEVHERGQTEHMPTGKQLETTALYLTTNVNKQSTLPPETRASPLPSRPTRVRRPPAWMSVFVSFCA